MGRGLLLWLWLWLLLMLLVSEITRGLKKGHASGVIREARWAWGSVRSDVPVPLLGLVPTVVLLLRRDSSFILSSLTSSSSVFLDHVRVAIRRRARRWAFTMDWKVLDDGAWKVEADFKAVLFLALLMMVRVGRLGGGAEGVNETTIVLRTPVTVAILLNFVSGFVCLTCLSPSLLYGEASYLVVLVLMK